MKEGFARNNILYIHNCTIYRLSFPDRVIEQVSPSHPRIISYHRFINHSIIAMTAILSERSAKLSRNYLSLARCNALERCFGVDRLRGIRLTLGETHVDAAACVTR